MKILYINWSRICFFFLYLCLLTYLKDHYFCFYMQGANSGVKILASVPASLCGALSIPDITDLIRILGLCIFGNL